MRTISSFITLTTDFGEDSPYVAAMKGVILSIHPQARIVDLSHHIPPQDLRHAGFFLSGAIPFFPPEAIHVIVVDPGVGTERRLLYVEIDGHRLLVPDNGCWTPLVRDGATSFVYQLVEAKYWRSMISSTFHGRDILAPVAAHLSLGLSPKMLGPRIENWITLDRPRPYRHQGLIHGEVIFVDHFGNLITNISADMIPSQLNWLHVGSKSIARFRQVRTYGEAKRGTMVVLHSSSNWLEVAVVEGNAAKRMSAKAGTAIRIG